MKQRGDTLLRAEVDSGALRWGREDLGHHERIGGGNDVHVVPTG
jgi:hypothetical protein